MGDVVRCGWGRSFFLLGMNCLRGTAFFVRKFGRSFLGFFEVLFLFLGGWIVDDCFSGVITLFIGITTPVKPIYIRPFIRGPITPFITIVGVSPCRCTRLLTVGFWW